MFYEANDSFWKYHRVVLLTANDKGGRPYPLLGVSYSNLKACEEFVRTQGFHFHYSESMPINKKGHQTRLYYCAGSEPVAVVISSRNPI